MQIAAAAISAIGSAVGAGGTAAATAGTAAAAAAPLAINAAGQAFLAGGTAAAGSGLLATLGAGSTWASILSGVATVGSALAAARSGKQDASGLTMQASDAEIEAGQEQVKGLERRNSLRTALIEQLAAQDTATAASGVDLSFGTPAVARQQAVTSAERALSVDQDTETIRRERLLQKAGNLRFAAGQARRGGMMKAAGIALEGGVSLLRRG